MAKQTPKARYELTPDRQTIFAGTALLELIVNRGLRLPSLLEGDNAFLEKTMLALLEKGHVSIAQGMYVATECGRDLLKKFLERCQDFLRPSRIFRQVDLGAGEFALAAYYDYSHEEGYEQAWELFLSDERWEDMRIAVAEYKSTLENNAKVDPIEIVFMSFINEGKFEEMLAQPGWQFNLVLPPSPPEENLQEPVPIFDRILRICNFAIPWDHPNVGEGVVRAVIEQGTPKMLELFKKEEELRQQALQEEEAYAAAQAATAQEEAGTTATTVTETVVVEEQPYDYYYNSYYYDPFFTPYSYPWRW